MTRYLSLAEVLELHRLIIAETGGSDGLRDLAMLESALGQPRQTFGGEDLAGAGQKYLYFLVAQDGTYLIKARSGEEVSDVQASTPHPASGGPAPTAARPTRSRSG